MTNVSVFDFHSHILPKADHGCGSGGEAVLQLELMKNAGIGNAVATPHFYPNRHDIPYFFEKLDASVGELRAALDERGDSALPRIALGAEVLICDNIHRMDDFEKLCIRGTNVMLLEFPMSGEWSSSLFDTVDAIQRRDITIVLAHIDRYLPSHREDIELLLDMGAYAQINASSFKRFMFKRHLAPFLSDDRLVAFGTDMHGEYKSAADAFAALASLKNGVFEDVMQRSASLLSGAEYI